VKDCGRGGCGDQQQPGAIAAADNDDKDPVKDCGRGGCGDQQQPGAIAAADNDDKDPVCVAAPPSGWGPQLHPSVAQRDLAYDVLHVFQQPLVTELWRQLQTHGYWNTCVPEHPCISPPTWDGKMEDLNDMVDAAAGLYKAVVDLACACNKRGDCHYTCLTLNVMHSQALCSGLLNASWR